MGKCFILRLTIITGATITALVAAILGIILRRAGRGFARCKCLRRTERPNERFDRGVCGDWERHVGLWIICRGLSPSQVSCKLPLSLLYCVVRVSVRDVGAYAVLRSAVGTPQAASLVLGFSVLPADAQPSGIQPDPLAFAFSVSWCLCLTQGTCMEA